MVDTPHRLTPLLGPRSVAIIGASPRENTLGNNVVVNLRRFGYAGAIFPVHPSAPEVAGLPAYRKLAGLPEPAFVIVSPMQSLNEIDDVFEAGQALKKAEGGAPEQHLQELARIAYGTTDTRLFLVGPKMSHVSKELAASDPDFWSPPAAATPPPVATRTEKSPTRPSPAPASPAAPGAPKP